MDTIILTIGKIMKNNNELIDKWTVLAMKIFDLEEKNSNRVIEKI